MARDKLRLGEIRFSLNRPTLYGPTLSFNCSASCFPSMNINESHITVLKCELCDRLFEQGKNHKCLAILERIKDK